MTTAETLRPKGSATRSPTWAIIGILSLCGTAVSLQQTLVVPLLHDFAGIFSVTPDTASWLVTATLLTSAVATPIVSRLADMFGKRRMMLVAMLAMTVGSLLGAIGGVFITALIGRSLQGFSSALIPIAISIMRDELPKEKVGSAVALMSATLGIGGAMGLPLSGVIFNSMGWHGIFWISAALGGALIAAVMTVVPESTVRTRGQFDYLGAVLLSLALTALLLAISKGSSWGWGSRATIGTFLFSVLCFAAWFPYELRANQPMVDLRTSGRRPVLLTNIASVLAGFAMFANLLLTTQQLQLPTATGYGFGLSVTVAGLLSIPQGLVMVVIAPISGQLINRFGGRITLVTGAAIMSLAYVGRVFFSGSLAEVIVGSTLVGLGTAVSFAAMPTLVMSSVPITETASANGLNSLVRAIGTSLSSAAVAAVLGSVTMQVGPTTLPSFDAFQDMYWLAGVAAFLGAVVAWYIPAQLRPAVGVEAAAALARGALPGVTPAGANREFVVSGSIRQADGTPARPAIISVLQIDGTPVDWARADNDGRYSVVLPEPGSYLVLANAQGWAPRAEVLEFGTAAMPRDITLTQQLTLSGTITKDGVGVADALVVLTEATGDPVGSVHADDRGRYRMPLPPAGRYIVTALEPGTLRAAARKTILDVRSAVVDVAMQGEAPNGGVETVGAVSQPAQ